MPSESANSALEEAESVICRIVRRKLRVTLSNDDGRENNLDALDVLGDVRLKLVRKLSQTEDAPDAEIEDWASYAATVAYNCCNDYLRAKYPERSRLKNALMRLLQKCTGCAVWTSVHGEVLCSFAGQRNEAPDSSRVYELRSQTRVLPAEVQAPQSLETFSPAALLRLVEAVWEHVGGPVPVDDMISVVETVWGIKEAEDVSLTPEDEDTSSPLDRIASTEEQPDSAWLTRERLKLLWGAILQLLPWHRAAYLLNLRDGELDSFPHYGVASVEQIGESLAFTDQQFQILAAEVALNPTKVSQTSVFEGSGQKFVIYWKYIPLEDNTIAKVLGVTRAQVIAYRNKGIERLRRQLKGAV